MCKAQDRKVLQQMIKTAQNITGTHLQSISDISEVRCLHRTQRILKDITPPQQLPVTERFSSSFFLQAVRLLNSSSAFKI